MDALEWFRWGLIGMEGFVARATRLGHVTQLHADQLKRMEDLADQLRALIARQRAALKENAS